MYVSPNFKTKRAMLEALAAGHDVSVYSPGPFPCPSNGETAIEGPHYPAPHSWYAAVTLTDGRIVSVDGKRLDAIRAKVSRSLACAADPESIRAALAARPAPKPRRSRAADYARGNAMLERLLR